MRTSPPFGCTRPATSISSVVFPDPEGPSKVRNSPSARSRLAPARAITSPYVLLRSRTESLTRREAGPVTNACRPAARSGENPRVEALQCLRLVLSPPFRAGLHHLLEVARLGRQKLGALLGQVVVCLGIGRAIGELGDELRLTLGIGAELDELLADFRLRATFGDHPALERIEALVPGHRNRAAGLDDDLRAGVPD